MSVDGKNLVVLLQNIRSLHNVGSIFRTADASGVGKIYLCGITPTPLNLLGKPEPKFTKVSLGAEKYVPWEKCKNISPAITALKKDGYKIFGLEQSSKSVAYDSMRLKKYKKIALIVGNEVSGIPAAILKKCSKVIEIPMRGAMVRQANHPRRTRIGKESLNVSVAFGIAIFELAKLGV